MSNFIKLKTTKGNDVFVNTNHIFMLAPEEGIIGQWNLVPIPGFLPTGQGIGVSATTKELEEGLLGSDGPAYKF